MQPSTPLMTNPHPKSGRWWPIADRIGATASFLCAIHCAILPFVIALLPVFGLEFLADHAFERIFVLCAALLATLVLVGGYRRHHRRRLPLMLAAPGVMLLILGVTIVDMQTQTAVHSVMVTCGGLLLALGHIMNLRLTYRAHAVRHVH